MRSSIPQSVRRPQGVLWVIAALLSVIAFGVWSRPSPPALQSAHAQGQALAGARGVFAFTGPIDRDQYGLFMLDIEQGTVWCYAFENVGGKQKLRLVAARTWIYDRYLQDFNCAEPDFRMVRELVDQQRARMSERQSPDSPDRQDAPPEDSLDR